jgi:hypothetical protein
MIRCCSCGKTIGEDNTLNFYPIEPMETPNRKWACDKCIQKSSRLKEMAKHIWNTKGRG